MQSRFSLPSSDRQYDTGRLDSSMNQCAYVELFMFTKAMCESLLASCGPRYIQQNAAHTAQVYSNYPTDYDATNREYADTSLVYTKRAYERVNIRNNDLIEIEVQIYEFLCVDDTAVDVLTECDRYHDIRRSGNYDISTDLLTNISHYASKLDHWKMLKTEKFRLNPGDEKVIYIKPGRGWYHSKTEQLLTHTYVKNISKSFVLRIVGTLGHDTTSKSLVGRLKCGVDYELQRFLEFRSYDGISKEFECATSQNYDTITVGEQSHVDYAQENPEN